MTRTQTQIKYAQDTKSKQYKVTVKHLVQKFLKSYLNTTRFHQGCHSVDKWRHMLPEKVERNKK